MTPERRKELETNTATTGLTPTEVDEGYHFCSDWDFMLVHKDDPEFKIECFCASMDRWRQ